MADHGFLRTAGATVGDLLRGRDPGLPLLVHTHPDETVRQAIEILREFEVSQMPVVKHEPPVVLAEVIGAVSERELLQAAIADSAALDKPVGDVMGPKMPTLGIGEPLDVAIARLEQASAALVLDGGHPVAVITRSDVLGSLVTERGR
jgi:cystathionine beta-synthase